jgi:superfamily II DNA or RNA helicase|tara:strand:+ start:2955 stop:4463 length:1509 start_codon:yes stop_codon:yes gene_type:complete
MSRSKNEKIVKLLKHGNRLLIEPTTPKILDILTSELTFTEVSMVRGWEAKQRRREGKSVMDYTDHPLFVLDHKSRIACPYGFWKRIKVALGAAGYVVSFKDLAPHSRPEVFEPRWQNIEGIELRAGQDKFLLKLLANRCGRFDCPPGYGKSFLIGMVGCLLPKARIDVVTTRVSVLRDRIFPELSQLCGDVGIVGGGKRRIGRRIMCYTAGSMHHAKGDADILFGDECHELGADRASQNLMRWDMSRNFGLSASHDKRIDGKDLRVEGIFGPVVHKVDYQTAQQDGLVAPIDVIWSNVVMDYDPCSGRYDVEKKRRGIWCNQVRNSVIAEDARKYGDDQQVLITCETIQHAVNLKALLPEYTLVYREGGLTYADRARYARQGLIESDERLMNLKRRIWLTKQFEKGELKKVICTTVWNVGVSFNNLEVLIRADAGGSPVNDVQIPGRVSRINDGKDHGIVHDYLDQFNSGFKLRAKKRSKTYKENSWEQDFPRKGLIEEYLA